MWYVTFLNSNIIYLILVKSNVYVLNKIFIIIAFNIQVLYDTPQETRTLTEEEMRELKDNLA